MEVHGEARVNSDQGRAGRNEGPRTTGESREQWVMVEPMGRRAEVERWALKAAAEAGWAIEGLAGASGGSRAIKPD